MGENFMETKAKKKWKTPHTFVILVVIILIAAAATYIVPAGEFTRFKDAVTGKTSIDEAFKYYEEKGGYYVNAILEDLNSEENLAEEAKAQEAADAVENKSTQGN